MSPLPADLSPIGPESYQLARRTIVAATHPAEIDQRWQRKKKKKKKTPIISAISIRSSLQNINRQHTILGHISDH